MKKVGVVIMEEKKNENKEAEKKDKKKGLNPVLVWSIIGAEVVIVLVIAFIVRHGLLH